MVSRSHGATGQAPHRSSTSAIKLNHKNRAEALLYARHRKQGSTAVSPLLCIAVGASFCIFAILRTFLNWSDAPSRAPVAIHSYTKGRSNAFFLQRNQLVRRPIAFCGERGVSILIFRCGSRGEDKGWHPICFNVIW